MPHRVAPNACRSELYDIRDPGGAEVADVDALRAANPDAMCERVVHVPEEGVPRLGRPDHLEQRGRAGLHPARLHVVEQLGDGRGNVGAEHVAA